MSKSQKLQQKITKKISRRGIVYIIKDRCKECGLCIEFCPMGVLQKSTEFNIHGYHFPIVVEKPPEKVCIACGFCTLICPEFAIYSKVMEEEQNDS
ncbi:MAG: ferredoxin family protein [Candidatus Njordarchaeum guaymaensis]